MLSRQIVNQLKLKPDKTVGLIAKASICHKSKLPPTQTYHWPYEKRSYGWGNFWLDPFTSKKFNDNSKIIQIEGNIESGKEDFGRRLAEQLGMKYMPPIDLDAYYINDMGYDYCALNPLLPERLRICNWEMFHECPNRHSVIHMQYYIYKLRLWQFIKALQHLFNTGQGVVLNRSVYTEKVMVDAMHEVGWLPMGYLRGDGMQFYDYKNRYEHIRNLTLAEVHKPHLTIYLETPVDVCMERIKNSKDPMIANSRAHVPEFLESIEKCYDDTLNRCELNGYVLRLDYKERATDEEILDVVDDIEKLDFTLDHKDTRFETWDDERMMFWYTNWRRLYTSQKVLRHFTWLSQPWFDIAGLGDSITQGDLILRTTLYEGHVGPLGYFKSRNADYKTRGFVKAVLDYRDFGERVAQAVRVDFV